MERAKGIRFLKEYSAERLPYLSQGDLEAASGEPSFTTDTRYRPLLDPASASSVMTA